MTEQKPKKEDKLEKIVSLYERSATRLCGYYNQTIARLKEVGQWTKNTG
jgi:hypothetical protein